MSYETLSKIYYKNSKEHNNIYMERFTSPFARRFNVEIKQFNHNKSFVMFYNYVEDLVLLIERIYSKKQELLTIIEGLPSVVLEKFNLYCVIDEVHSTSAIEGVHSTHRELKEIIEGRSNSKHFTSIIKKYDMLVLNEGIDFNTCRDIRVFYDEFVSHDIVSDDPKDVLDGEIFRGNDVDIMSSSGKILHRGLYPEVNIIETMEKALNILHDESIPVLIRIALFHFLFVYIHPFYNGNGRTARFISSYYFAENFHYLPALRLSYVIKRQRKRYYDLIHNTEMEINCGDLTPFILGFCSIFYETLVDVCDILSRKSCQIRENEHKILELFSEDKLTTDICLILLYSSAFFGEGLSINELMDKTKKSRNTLKDRLKSIPEGLIEVNTDKVNNRKLYRLNPVIFSD